MSVASLPEQTSERSEERSEYRTVEPTKGLGERCTQASITGEPVEGPVEHATRTRISREPPEGFLNAHAWISANRDTNGN